MDSDEMSKRLVRRGQRKLLLLAAISVLPLIIAYALYYGGWRPSATGNYGELLQPPRSIDDVSVLLLDGKKIRISELRGKWLLLTFGTAECLTPCEKSLYAMRQVIAAQGKKAERVRSVLVVTDAHALGWPRYTTKDYPHLQVITGPAAEVQRLARQFTLPDGSPPATHHRIYLVDPLGNFIMSYGEGVDPSGIRKDLTRLLRVSRIG